MISAKIKMRQQARRLPAGCTTASRAHLADDAPVGGLWKSRKFNLNL